MENEEDKESSGYLMTLFVIVVCILAAKEVCDILQKCGVWW